MFLLLVLVFLVIPIAELWVIVAAAQTFGIPETLAVLILVSIAGVWVVKWAGVSVLMRMQRTVRRGDVPTREVVDGFLVLLAGALLITPGFLTDLMAMFLLLPPTRAIARRLVLRRYNDRLAGLGVHDGANLGHTYRAYRDRRGNVVDVDGHSESDVGSVIADPFGELGP